jgi:2-iminobutanoate/2-iminopropanoate deaminase
MVDHLWYARLNRSRRTACQHRRPNRTGLAWQHIIAMLAQASMTVADVVKVTQYLTQESDIAEYAKVRSKFLGDARPASMLLVVPALVRPGFLVEVEVMAAKA